MRDGRRTGAASAANNVIAVMHVNVLDFMLPPLRFLPSQLIPWAQCKAGEVVPVHPAHERWRQRAAGWVTNCGSLLNRGGAHVHHAVVAAFYAWMILIARDQQPSVLVAVGEHAVDADVARVTDKCRKRQVKRGRRRNQGVQINDGPVLIDSSLSHHVPTPVRVTLFLAPQAASNACRAARCFCTRAVLACKFVSTQSREKCGWCSLRSCALAVIPNPLPLTLHCKIRLLWVCRK